MNGFPSNITATSSVSVLLKRPLLTQQLANQSANDYNINSTNKYQQTIQPLTQQCNNPSLSDGLGQIFTDFWHHEEQLINNCASHQNELDNLQNKQHYYHSQHQSTNDQSTPRKRSMCAHAMSPNGSRLQLPFINQNDALEYTHLSSNVQNCRVTSQQNLQAQQNMYSSLVMKDVATQEDGESWLSLLVEDPDVPNEPNYGINSSSTFMNEHDLKTKQLEVPLNVFDRLFTNITTSFPQEMSQLHQEGYDKIEQHSYSYNDGLGLVQVEDQDFTPSLVLHKSYSAPCINEDPQLYHHHLPYQSTYSAPSQSYSMHHQNSHPYTQLSRTSTVQSDACQSIIPVFKSNDFQAPRFYENDNGPHYSKFSQTDQTQHITITTTNLHSRANSQHTVSMGMIHSHPLGISPSSLDGRLISTPEKRKPPTSPLAQKCKKFNKEQLRIGYVRSKDFPKKAITKFKIAVEMVEANRKAREKRRFLFLEKTEREKRKMMKMEGCFV